MDAIELDLQPCTPLKCDEENSVPRPEEVGQKNNLIATDGESLGSGDENQKRGNWSHKTEYILSLLGYSVGLSNLWRFPYICYRNGGGAFLICYWICMFSCGVPLFFMEVALGQFTSRSAASMWTLSPIFKGAGYATIVVTLIITAYYQVLMAYIIYYFINSFTLGELPWQRCGNSWNSANCLDYNNHSLKNSYFHYLSWKKTGTGNISLEQLAFFGNKTFRSPGEEYFLNRAINLEGSLENLGPVVWHVLLCLIPSWIITFFCLVKGVKSVGKVVYITATFPYVMLTALLIRGLTLPGAMEGIRFYIVPNFTRLQDPNVWCDAASQVFYSLGPGWGALITMGSYNRFHNNCYRDGIFAPIAMGLTSFYAGFAVFSAAGFMSHVIGRPVGEVVDQGPQLAFVMYPEVVSRLPFAPLWAVLFFFMLFTLGMDTVLFWGRGLISTTEMTLFMEIPNLNYFVMVETAITAAWDELPEKYKIKRIYILIISSILLFIAAIPATTRGGMYLFQIVDSYTATHTVIIVCLIELVAVSWIYGAERFLDDIKCMIGYHPPIILWSIIWRFITLAILVLILTVAIVRWTPVVKYQSYIYPPWAKGLGAFFVLVAFLWIPAWAIFQLIRAPGKTLKQVKFVEKNSDFLELK